MFRGISTLLTTTALVFALGCGKTDNPITPTGTAPSVPNLQLPVDGAHNQPIASVLTWGAVSGAATYHIQLSKSSAFSPVLSEDSTITSLSVTISGLAKNTTYYWRVGAKNSSGKSAWSNGRSFITIPSTIMVKDSFETTDLSLGYSDYRLSADNAPMPYLSTSTAAAHAGTRSLTSADTAQAIRASFADKDSGIVGVEFYMMAKSSGTTNFFIAIGQGGSSSMGAVSYLGMGFDKSDSIKYVYYTDPPATETSKNVAKIQFNKWYKCTIEYDFTGTKTVVYYLDDVEVGRKALLDLGAFGMVIAYRDNKGSAGAKELFFDDLIAYQR